MIYNLVTVSLAQKYDQVQVQESFGPGDGRRPRTQAVAKCILNDTAMGGKTMKDNKTRGPDHACFLTTATVHAMGLPDQCEPLELARFLRDEKMTSSREVAAVDLYYKVAPVIVERSTDEEWVVFWREHMRKISTLIKMGEYDLAKDLYTLATATLVDEKATRFDDRELVEEVYDYGLKGFAKSWLPYSLRYVVLKAALFVGLKYQGVRLQLAQRRFAHVLSV